MVRGPPYSPPDIGHHWTEFKFIRPGAPKQATTRDVEERASAGDANLGLDSAGTDSAGPVSSGRPLLRGSLSASVCLGGATSDAFEGIAEGALGGVAERTGDSGDSGVVLAQGAFREAHAPFGQISQGCDASDRPEMDSESG